MHTKCSAVWKYKKEIWRAKEENCKQCQRLVIGIPGVMYIEFVWVSLKEIG